MECIAFEDNDVVSLKLTTSKKHLHTWDDGDWYQVESLSVAEKIDEVYDGWKIEKEYTSPRISRTNGKCHWNRK